MLRQAWHPPPQAEWNLLNPIIRVAAMDGGGEAVAALQVCYLNRAAS
jgi:hypothetical protein